jgi:spore maturation protein CgeB
VGGVTGLLVPESERAPLRRILVVGDGHSPIHEVACAQALKQLGHDAHLFQWYEYFGRYAYRRMSGWEQAFLRLQHRLVWGPVVWRVNADLVRRVDDVRPDVVLVYRGTHILPSTLRRIKRRHPKCVLASYNNDDPFSAGASRALWRHYVAAVPDYDVHFVYRHANLEDVCARGAGDVHVLRSYFIEELNRPVALSADEQERFGCDVVFAGHYEPDGRVEVLEALVAHYPHVRLRVFGHGWNARVRASHRLRQLYPVAQLPFAEYNRAICGAKIALCFLSKLNRDTYTRRCFEIPAAGVLLLSEYSADLASLFKEGEEADFFRGRSECLEKIGLYLMDDDRRRRVADAGRRRVHEDGHSVVSRMQQAMKVLEKHIINVPPGSTATRVARAGVR